MERSQQAAAPHLEAKHKVAVGPSAAVICFEGHTARLRADNTDGLVATRLHRILEA